MDDHPTLLKVCVTRALELADAGRGDPLGPWTIMTAAGRGAKCAAFIATWAGVLGERGIDELSIEDYGRAGYDSLRTSYRRLADFRQMFPHETDPTRIALLLLSEARARRERPSPKLAIAV